MPPSFLARPTTRRRILAVGLGLALAAVLGELALRTVLFATPAIGWSLRDPARFADPRYDDDFTKLSVLWRGAPVEAPAALVHPTLGWVSEALDPATLEHVGQATLRGRRPVLLYGDSYSYCVTERGTRFEDLLERSPLRATHALLNHGVCGYGLDQAALLFDATLDRYSAERPLVLFGVFVDDDLDRCALSLRVLPKPRFVLHDGELELKGVPVPTMRRYLAEQPLTIDCYLARALALALLRERLPRHRALDAEKRALTFALVQRIARTLRQRGVDGVFVLFEGEERTAADEPVRDWRMRTLVEALEAEGLPHVATREHVRARAAAEGRSPREFFIQGGQSNDHFDAEGNAAASTALFEAIALLD